MRDTRIDPGGRGGRGPHRRATFTIVNDATGQTVACDRPRTPRSSDLDGLRRDSGVGPVAVASTSSCRAARSCTIGSSSAIRTRPARRRSSRSAARSSVPACWRSARALVTGIIAARTVTLPIGRLRRVAGGVAQGRLDERAAPSGVLEIDELGQQFNVMADRLSGTLRMLEADRDRLREFVADVSHELRTPIAALRIYTELQRHGEVDEATRRSSSSDRPSRSGGSSG